MLRRPWLAMLLLGFVVHTMVAPTARARADDSAVGHVGAVGGEPRITVKARLTGWVDRREGFFFYPPGATARLRVNVWPALGREPVRARLEWRRAGSRWRLIQVSVSELSHDGRALFLVRNLPEGYSFRIRARVPPGEEHRAGRSVWRYFRAR